MITQPTGTLGSPSDALKDPRVEASAGLIQATTHQTNEQTRLLALEATRKENANKLNTLKSSARILSKAIMVGTPACIISFAAYHKCKVSWDTIATIGRGAILAEGISGLTYWLAKTPKTNTTAEQDAQEAKDDITWRGFEQIMNTTAAVGKGLCAAGKGMYAASNRMIVDPKKAAVGTIGGAALGISWFYYFRYTPEAQRTNLSTAGAWVRLGVGAYFPAAAAYHHGEALYKKARKHWKPICAAGLIAGAVVAGYKYHPEKIQALTSLTKKVGTAGKTAFSFFWRPTTEKIPEATATQTTPEGGAKGVAQEAATTLSTEQREQTPSSTILSFFTSSTTEKGQSDAGVENKNQAPPPSTVSPKQNVQTMVNTGIQTDLLIPSTVPVTNPKKPITGLFNLMATILRTRAEREANAANYLEDLGEHLSRRADKVVEVANQLKPSDLIQRSQNLATQLATKGMHTAERGLEWVVLSILGRDRILKLAAASLGKNSQ